MTPRELFTTAACNVMAELYARRREALAMNRALFTSSTILGFLAALDVLIFVITDKAGVRPPIISGGAAFVFEMYRIWNFGPRLLTQTRYQCAEAERIYRKTLGQSEISFELCETQLMELNKIATQK